VGGGGQWK